MTDFSIKLRYRISSRGGILFVRELQFGEVVARIPSSKSTFVASDAVEVAAECRSFFLGQIESVVHDDDVVHVICCVSKK